MGLEEFHVLFDEDSHQSSRLGRKVDTRFMWSVAQHCPKLKRLIINEVLEATEEVPLPRITNAGLLEVAKMPFLEQITLKQT
jgi:hypothetical protein